MTFTQARAIVETEFRTREVAEDGCAVCVNQSFNGSELFYIELCEEEGVAVLTDNGETRGFFYKVTEEEWQRLCNAAGFAYQNGRIKRPFREMGDLHEYIEFLIRVTDQFS